MSASAWAFSPRGADVAERSAGFLARDGVSCSEIVPWMFPWDEDERIIVNKDGSLLACFSVAGLDIDSTGNAEMNGARQQILYAFAQLQDQNITLGWQVRRREARESPAARFPEPVSEAIEARQREALSRRRLFAGELFVSLTQAPAHGSDQMLARIGRALARQGSWWRKSATIARAAHSALMGQPDFAHQTREDLEHAAGRFARLLSQFDSGLARLGLRALRGDELASHLSKSLSPASRADSAFMPDTDFLDTTLARDWIGNDLQDVLVFDGGARRLYGASYTLQLSKRERAHLGIFDALMAAPFEFVFGQVFRFLPPAAAARGVAASERYHSVRRYPVRAYIAAALGRGGMESVRVDEQRQEAATEAERLRSAVATGARGLGLWYAGITVLAATPAQLAEDCAALEKILHAEQLAPMRESLHKLCTFCASVPAAHQEIARWFKVSTEVFCHLAPVRTVAEGQRINAYLSEQSGVECPALLVLPTRHNSAYHFTGYVGQLGHALLLGPSATGKTTLLNLAWSAFRKYPNARVIGFDRDYSMRPPMLLQGANYIDLRPEKREAGGARLGPLRALMSAGETAHLPWCLEWLELLASHRGYQVSSADRLRLESVLRGLLELGRARPQMLTLSSVLVQLDNTTDLARNLMPWTRGHALGEYFDNDRDDLSLAGLDGIEAGLLLENETLARPFLSYVFYRISSLLRRNLDARGVVPFPTLISVPEVAHFLQNAQFAAELDKWLTTLRKLNAAVWMDTQSPDKILESRAYAAVRDNVASVIFTPNPRALAGSLASKYLGEFGLTEQELQFIANGSPACDYFIKQGPISRRVALSLEPALMVYLRSDKRAQLLLEQHLASAKPDWRQAYARELLGSAS